MNPESTNGIVIDLPAKRMFWVTLFCGLFLLSVEISFFLIGITLPQGAPYAIVLPGILFLGATSIFFFFAMKIRVDAEGIVVVYPFRSERWYWSDFQSGRIENRFGDFYDPKRIWPCRKLPINELDQHHKDLINARIDHFYKLNPPPALPTQLCVRESICEAIRFDSNGVEIKTLRTQVSFTWLELIGVWILRPDPNSRNALRIVFEFPDEEVDVDLKKHGLKMQALDVMIERFVDPSKVFVVAEPSAMDSIEFADREIRRVKKSFTNSWVDASINSLLFAMIGSVLFATIAILDPEPDVTVLTSFLMPWLFMLLMFAFVYPVTWIEMKTEIKKVRDREKSSEEPTGLTTN